VEASNSQVVKKIVNGKFSSLLKSDYGVQTQIIEKSVAPAIRSS